MRITNKLNLNSTLYKTAVDSVRPLSTEHYSVTELLKPTADIVLTHRHYNDIVTDVADLVPALFGSALHKLLETQTTDALAELRLEFGRVCGVCDLYNPVTATLEDYKTTSVSKVMREDFAEHLLQCKLYAWLIYMVRGELVRHIRINYLLKDWSKVQLSIKAGYPASPIYTLERDITDSDYDEAATYIRHKLADIDALADTPDSELPACDEAERWHKSDTWRLYAREDSPRALRVLDHEPTAEERGHYIVRHTPGEDTRCCYYCAVARWCTHPHRN